MVIRELDLQQLGFEKVVITPEESGDPLGFYYYELSLSDENENFCLVSQESDKVNDDIWMVKLFETGDYIFQMRDELKDFISSVLKYKKSITINP
jgi:hypothetical protein